MKYGKAVMAQELIFVFTYNKKINK